MRGKHVRLQSVLFTSQESLSPELLADLALRCTMIVLPTRAALRAINPGCNHRAVSVQPERTGVVYQGPSCPCGVTSKPLVSVCPLHLLGVGVSGKLTVRAEAKRLLTLILSPAQRGVDRRAHGG